MSSLSRRQSGGGEWLGLAAVLAVVAAAGVFAGLMHAGNAVDGGPQTLPANPVRMALQLVSGELYWPRSATVLAVAAGIVLVLLAVVVGVLVARRAKGRTRVDRAARHMAGVRELRGLSPSGARATADQLGVTADEPGLPIAVTLSGTQLYSSYEDVSVDIWGPRTGKTMSRAIPAILAAPGMVLATSNKRDLCDATRDLRAHVGQVWVFDPQQLAGERASWWWNPLSYVTGPAKARALAKVLGEATKPPGARADEYFAPAAADLLGDLLLAAAVGGNPLTDVYMWLIDLADDEDPQLLLERGGYPLNAASVRKIRKLPYKQREGIVDGARQTMSFLVNPDAAQWVTPTSERRPQLDVDALVSGTDTLYLLSKEGEGTTTPLVTALTIAVLEAAERLGARSPRGRVPVPVTCVLDEAANVVRWQQLPNMYSHFGSRGITVLTILQSWSQGVDVWGQEGMRKLWSAANVRVYGGGDAEPQFLGDLVQLIGKYDLRQVSTSVGRGHRSTSRSITRENVLDVDELADLPRGRAIVFSSGHPAALVRTVRWTETKWADLVAASIAAHDPQAERTLAEARAAEHDVPSAAELRDANPWVR